MLNRRIFSILFITIFVLGLVGCGGGSTATQAPSGDEQQPTAQSSAANFRVAMVFPGAINDKSWNQAGYDGLMRIQKELGVETSFQENVAASDWEEAMRTYASQGYNLVIGHGDQFSDASKVVSAEFPNTMFVVVNGANSGPNLASISLFDEQVTYLAGIVAAKMSKSGKIGYIGGLEIPPVVRNGKGFEAGAKSVNPDIEVSTTYLGDFNDASKGKETTLSMADQGVDVIYYYVDNAMVGIQEAAKEKNIKLIGCIFDQHDMAPDLILTSTIQDTSTAIFQAAQQAKEGTLKGGMVLFGLDSGAIKLAQFSTDVPADVQAAVKQAQDDIIAGKIKIERTQQ